MNKVVHFEIPADDEKRAHEFYQNVFGWKVHAIPSMGYAMVNTGKYILIKFMSSLLIIRRNLKVNYFIHNNKSAKS
jgi:hypothetical protein